MKRRRIAVPDPSRVVWLGLIGLLGLLSLLLALPAWAEDPPARAGRVSDISGEAWIFDSQSRDWERLARNQTVAEGDRLRSDGSSRITLRIGSTTLWLDERSELEVERMDDERVLLRVDRGGLALKLRSREQAQDYRLLTREGRLFLDGEGMFRIDQLERGSRAMAWQGRARFEFRTAEADPVWLAPGEQAELWWSQGPRTERQSVERDSFARWLQNQRETEGEMTAHRYVSPEMTGAEDLDRFGRWDRHDEYGALWYPTQVAVDWAPYQHGRWVWTARWGWTWVDAQPWGFAPFHYGRWVRVGGRWGWAPGRYVARPVYSPALVAWSSGPHLSVGVTIGGSRPPPPRPGMWAPLAPYQVYQPHYRHTPNYRDRINRDHDPVYVPRPGDGVQRPPRPRDEPGLGLSVQPGRGQGGTGVVRPQPPQVAPPQVQPPQVQVPNVQVPNVQAPQVPGAPVPVPVRPVPPRPADPIDAPRPQRGEPGVPMSAPERAWQQTEQRNERAERIERIERIERGADAGVPMSAIERAQQRNERAEPPERRIERGIVPGFQQPQIAMPPQRPVERAIERPMERPMEQRPVERAMPMPVPPRVPQPAPERARPGDERGEKRSRGEPAEGVVSKREREQQR